MDISTLFPDLPELITKKNKKVGDQEVSSCLLSEGAASPDLAFSNDTFLFSASGEASVSVNLYNNANDHGEEKVFKHWPKAGDLYKDKALLSYGVKGKIKAEASGSALEKFEVGIDAEQYFTIKSFRIHPKEEEIDDAFKADIRSFRQIFSIQSIEELQVHEALTMETAGKLELTATVKVSDVYSGTAAALASLLNLSGHVNMTLDASASLSFTVGIEDDFSVIIIRQEEDVYDVIINKIIKRSGGLTAKAGIDASLIDDDQLDDVVDQFFESIDEGIFTPLNEALKNASGYQAVVQSGIVEKAKNLLGIELPGDEGFVTAYEEKKEELKEKLLEEVENKVAIGIAYEYEMIHTNQTIFKAEFSKDRLVDHHKKIIQLKVCDIVQYYLAAPKDQKPFVLKTYLKRDIRQLNRSFGISLSLGNFTLSSNILKEYTSELVQSEDESGIKYKVDQYNSKATKTYEHGKNKDTYIFAFDASMPHFVPLKSDLTMEKFDFSVGVSFEMTENRTNEKELRDVVDWALTWDIIPQSRVPATMEQIKKDVFGENARGITYKCFLKIPKGDFDLFLPHFSQIKTYIIPNALAAALPQVDYADMPDFKIRQQMELRRKHYTDFWKSYLLQIDTTASDMFLRRIASLLASEFHKADLEDLAEYESGEGNYDRLIDRHHKGSYNSGKVIEILKGNSDIRRDVNIFIQDMERINDAIKGAEHYDKKKIRNSLRRLGDTKFLKDFNMRFFGRLLLDMNEAFDLGADIEKGLSITYTKDEEEKVYVIA